MCSLVEGGGQFFTKTPILKTRGYMMIMIMIMMIMMSASASFQKRNINQNTTNNSPSNIF